jgi:hypothetical protein
LAETESTQQHELGSNNPHPYPLPPPQHPLPTLVGLDQGGKVRHAERGVRHPTALCAGAAWAGVRYGTLSLKSIGRGSTSILLSHWTTLILSPKFWGRE